MQAKREAFVFRKVTGFELELFNQRGILGALSAAVDQLPQRFALFYCKQLLKWYVGAHSA